MKENNPHNCLRLTDDQIRAQLECLVVTHADLIEHALYLGKDFYDIAFDLAKFGTPIVVSDLRECYQRLGKKAS